MVVVEELQPHVDGGEVVGQPPAEEVLLLPVDGEVWAQALVVEVVRVLLPEREPVASHEPQAAVVLDPHKMGSISGQGVVAVLMRLRVLTMMMGLKPA